MMVNIMQFLSIQRRFVMYRVVCFVLFWYIVVVFFFGGGGRRSGGFCLRRSKILLIIPSSPEFNWQSVFYSSHLYYVGDD